MVDSNATGHEKKAKMGYILRPLKREKGVQKLTLGRAKKSPGGKKWQKKER
jgi:hypothetical protein